MIHSHRTIQKICAILLTAFLLIGSVGCTQLAASSEKAKSEQAELKLETESQRTVDEEPAYSLDETEKEILTVQAEYLTKQIIMFSIYDLPKSDDEIPYPDNAEIRNFLHLLDFFDDQENYPYQNTHRTESDGTCYFKREAVDQIIQEVFHKTSWSHVSIPYNEETQEYSFMMCAGEGFNRDCKEFKAEFQKNDTELVLSYELWTSPYYPNVEKTGECQTVFAVKQREDKSYYLQYLKTDFSI